MRILLLSLLVVLVVSCITIKVHKDGTREVRTLGASVTTVKPNGSITTKSEGLFETGSIVSIVKTAGDAFLAFFNRGPVSDPPVEE